MRTIKPLEITHLFVLLALADRPMHGYDIHAQVEQDSQSTIYFSYPALYNLLHILRRKELIEVVVGGISLGPKRTTYTLTLKGRRELKATGVQLWDAGRLVRERVA